MIAGLLLAALLPAAGQATALPEWWPGDVQLPEQATLVTVDEAREKGLPKVEFRVPTEGTSAKALIDVFASALGERGWTIDQRRARSTSDSITATRRDIDKRVIITAWEPGTLFNKHKDAYKLEVVVYRSIP
ncbi:MAG: hypothetical protein R3F15_16095 [Lysobacterales bacterium]